MFFLLSQGFDIPHFWYDAVKISLSSNFIGPLEKKDATSHNRSTHSNIPV